MQQILKTRISTTLKNLNLISNTRVENVFANYPEHIRPKMYNLRRLILEAASESAEIQSIEETLKWGEPSYLTKTGSTVRMDWKSKSPEQYALYFKCTSKLVSTFRQKFADELNFEENRAIIFKLDEEVPEKLLKQCVRIALTYHKLKTLPNLGLEL